MTRNILITAADGNTGFCIAELLLTHNKFKSKVDSIVGMTLHPNAAKSKELTELGAKVLPHKPGRVREMAKTLKETGVDTLCLIPPPHEDKFDISVELVEAAKKAGIPNVLLISSVGCDLAERDKEPRLREFIDIETVALSAKGDSSTSAGASPCVIRAGFYAENLLVYSPQAKNDGIITAPLGQNHSFAPVALGDVALLAAHVLTGKGKNGFDDKHRGQLMVLTGPALVTGDELATNASNALGVDMSFEDISEAEAKKVLRHQSSSDDSEKEYLLEYYRLVREGKTNYISTTAFVHVTGQHPMEPPDFFKAYVDDFKELPARKKRKVENGHSK